MSEEQTKPEENTQGMLRSYTIGFVLSLLCTFAAYASVVMLHLSQSLSIALILCFAMIQLIVQLVFFLHLGQESKPRWNLGIFIATIAIVLLVVIGSIWIMTHLNYNMMPHHVEEFLIQDEGIKR